MHMGLKRKAVASFTVTLVQDLFLRLYLVLAESPTNWQKEPRRAWQYGACIAIATEPSVLTLLLKQAQLFMRAKLNQTVGVAEKTSVKSFCLESH